MNEEEGPSKGPPKRLVIGDRATLRRVHETKPSDSQPSTTITEEPTEKKGAVSDISDNVVEEAEEVLPRPKSGPASNPQANIEQSHKTIKRANSEGGIGKKKGVKKLPPTSIPEAIRDTSSANISENIGVESSSPGSRVRASSNDEFRKKHAIQADGGEAKAAGKRPSWAPAEVSSKAIDSFPRLAPVPNYRQTSEEEPLQFTGDDIDEPTSPRDMEEDEDEEEEEEEEEEGEDSGLEIQEVSLGFLSIATSQKRSIDLGQMPNKLEDKLKSRSDKRNTLTATESFRDLTIEIERMKLATSLRNSPVKAGGPPLYELLPPGEEIGSDSEATDPLSTTDLSGDESGGDSKQPRGSVSEECWPKEDSEFISSCVERLFCGKTLQEEDLQQLALLFALKWGRRCFSRCLTQQRVRRNISLVDASFSEMCALFEAALIEAERNGDYRCAKHLIHMSLTFYRTVGTGWSDSEAHDFIQNTLKRSELITIWTKQVFWEEMFYDSVIEEREKVGKELLAGAAWRTNEVEDLLNQERNFVFGQLGTYSSTMLGYGVTLEDTESFVKKQCDTYKLSEEFRTMLLLNLNSLGASQKVEDEELEKKLKKEAWLNQRKEAWNRSQQRRDRFKGRKPSFVHRPVTSHSPYGSGIVDERTLDKDFEARQREREREKERLLKERKEREKEKEREREKEREKERDKDKKRTPTLYKLGQYIMPAGGRRAASDGSLDRDATKRPKMAPGSLRPKKGTSTTPTSPTDAPKIRHSNYEQTQEMKNQLNEQLRRNTAGSHSKGAMLPPETRPFASAEPLLMHPKEEDNTEGSAQQSSNTLQTMRLKKDSLEKGIEMANIQREMNKRLVKLIKKYERQYTVYELALVVYPSLRPPPYGISSPAKMGHLEKMSGNLKKSWKRYLFVLKDDFLFLYENSTAREPQQIIRVVKEPPTRIVSVVMGVGFGSAQKYAHCLEIPILANGEKLPKDKKPKTILVSARDAFDQREWLYSLRKAASSKWFKNKDCSFLQRKSQNQQQQNEPLSPRENSGTYIDFSEKRAKTLSEEGVSKEKEKEKEGLDKTRKEDS